MVSKAEDLELSLSNLKEYYQDEGDVRIHLPFIKGQNDSHQNIVQIVEKVQSYGIFCDFNIVRYNDFNGDFEESDMERILELQMLIESYNVKAKIITRVGEDVAASCGMFFN